MLTDFFCRVICSTTIQYLVVRDIQNLINTVKGHLKHVHDTYFV